MRMLLAGTERLNLPRYTGRRCLHEVYYLRFADVGQKVGVWYRQTLLHQKQHPPEAALWMMLFDLADPNKNVAWQIGEPIGKARLERDIFYFEVAGGKLYHKGSHGEFQQGGSSVKWEFHWKPNAKTFFHLPSRLFYHIPFPKMKLLSPNADIRLSGHLQWGERRFEFNDVPAQQSHLWGKTHPTEWVWGHTNSFIGEEAFFEGLSARVRLGDRLLPPLTILRAVIAGREYRLNHMWQWRKNTSNAHVDRWHFEGEGRGARIVGDVFVDREHIVGVTYNDPDGSKRYCYHTESARLELFLYRRVRQDWVQKKRLQSQPAMAFEFATSKPLPDIPLKL